MLFIAKKHWIQSVLVDQTQNLELPIEDKIAEEIFASRFRISNDKIVASLAISHSASFSGDNEPSCKS